MKKIVAGLLAVSMVFGAGGVLGNLSSDVFTLTASADEEQPTSGKCGENVTWVFDEDGTLTISGEGDMYLVDKPISLGRKTDEVKKVVIENGVTSIGNSAFTFCMNLTSVTIPNSVTKIGKYAFMSCGSLNKINIPNGVTRISDYTFTHCSNLKSVTIPENVTYIGECAFMGCTNLTDIKIPNSVTNIGECAFVDCDNLTKITIPNNVIKMGYGTFANCEELTTAVISDGVTSISEYAFYGCPKLKSVTIPSSVRIIGEKAFGYYNDKEKDIIGTTIKNFTIRGTKDTAAEKYAKNNEFRFVEMSDAGIKGDVNNDGKINITDITKIALHIKGKKFLTKEQKLRADINNDGNITITDLTRIAAHVKGKKSL
ncbi:leucine-rich repeat protein [Ruminococcus albus]|uniref:Leucine rich repeat-containing protein n=1 Tax=Ruminococcus albus TaxID=1264 RepID=A0A1H7JS00_RUMAL|nr:leucine-rich repeat protein [Ruminococcus albus]SEK77174.1 Leucine rich repeat-containing protein [Ruminococcus albus]